MAERECANLIFTLTDTETSQSLILGEGGGLFAEIQKSEDMFASLKGFTTDNEEGRTIPIPIYLQSMNDTLALNRFFKADRKYDLKILLNNVSYYTQCQVEEPEIENCDDLYGDKSKLIVYTVNLKLLKTRNYFLSNVVSTHTLSSQIKPNFRFGKYGKIPLKNEIKKIPYLLDEYEGSNLSFKKINEEEYRLVADKVYLTPNQRYISFSNGFCFKVYQFFYTVDTYYENQYNYTAEEGEITVYDSMTWEEVEPDLQKAYSFTPSGIFFKYGYIMNTAVSLNIKNKRLLNLTDKILYLEFKSSYRIGKLLDIVEENGNILLKGTGTNWNYNIYRNPLENYVNIQPEPKTMEEYKNLKFTQSNEVIASSGKPIEYCFIDQNSSPASIFYDTVQLVLKYVGSEFPENYPPTEQETFTFNFIGNNKQLEKPYYFSKLIYKQPKVVTNYSGMPVGMVIIFKVLGDYGTDITLENPIIKNLTTNKSMQINITAKSGDTLEIDTDNKTVKLNDTYYNNVKKIFDEWLVLKEGENVIDYSIPFTRNISVEVLYRNKFRGL